MNLTEPIFRHARRQPDAAALVDGERTITYGALGELVSRTAGHLHALGVRRGDYVGLCLRDNWQHVVALLAIARLGAVFVQIDPRARPAEKARIADAIAFKLALVTPHADIGANCRVEALDAAWWRAVAAADPGSEVVRDWQAPFAILSSSGTTGRPKFAVATHLEFYCRFASYGEVVPASRRHRYLSTLSISFSAGRAAFLSHLLHGDTVVFHASTFTGAEFVETVSRQKISVAFVVPSVVRQLLQIAGTGSPLLPDLDVFLSAGAPLFADEKRDAFHKLTPNFHEMYGATAIGVMSVLRPNDMLERSTSVGRPFSLIDLEVVDESDRPLDVGEAGYLRCRGPALASPWGGTPEATSSEFRDGWHYPGEVATVDSCGYVFLQGRKSEVIFRGGAKIFPAEVEAALMAHEGVAEAVVVGRASAGKEQELVAYVIASRPLEPGELLAHCRTRLTAYKVPRDIHVVSELPRNPSGKLDKRALTNWTNAEEHRVSCPGLPGDRTPDDSQTLT